jgi:polyadenylate-binding protein
MATPNTGNASVTPYTSPSLYCGDLLPDVTEAILYEIFSAVGHVISVRVCRDNTTRRSLGYAYVNFSLPEDAERALDTMNFKPIRGRPCRLMWSHRDPHLRKSGVGNIYIKNLNKSIDSKQLYDTFSMFGNILSCKVATKPGKDDMPISLGYGFVHYETDEAAAKAIEKVHNHIIMGERVSVEVFRPRSARNSATVFNNLYVRNVPVTFTKEQLQTMFGGVGELISVVVGEDTTVEEKEEKRNYGFVCYKSHDDAVAAIDKFNNTDVEGSELKLIVVRAQTKAERQKATEEKRQKEKTEKNQAYQGGVNLYVKNLADTMTDERLREEFSKYGSITSTKVMRDKDTQKSRGFGFVCFSTTEEATKAVSEMNGAMIEKKPLYVALHQSKEQRSMRMQQMHNNPKGGPRQMGGPAPMGYNAPNPMYQNMRPMVGYPQQMPMQGNWPNQPHMNVMGRPMNYQLMPVQNQRGGAPMRGGQRGPSNMRAVRQPQQGGYAPRPTGPNPQMMMQQPQHPAEMDMKDLVKQLAQVSQDERTRMIGERLFPKVKEVNERQAGKITGMLLEMDNSELIDLLDNENALVAKIREAEEVLGAEE